MIVHIVNCRYSLEDAAKVLFSHTGYKMFPVLQACDEFRSAEQDMVRPNCAAPLVGPDHADLAARSIADGLDDSVNFLCVPCCISFLLYCSIGCLPMIWRNAEKIRI